MSIALKEAKKAFDKDEIPVGCVLVCDDVVIAKAHNTKEKNYSITGHAEINCLNKAYEIYSSLSSKYYEDVTKLTLVHSLYNQNHIEQANLLLSDLLNDTNLNHKVKLASEITIAFTSILLNNEDEFSSAVQIY